jgi:GT2 family glycosyltransferase
MRMDLLVLNHNGRDLLSECLPSLLRAAAASRHDCPVTVVDNASSDDSLSFLAAEYPQVQVIRCANRGLCSFNDVLARLTSRVAILLNNDIKLDAAAIDPLIQQLLTDERCFAAAPLCWLFDGRTYEGLKTAVRWRFGLVQATALFAGHETGIHQAGLTASAGAVLAVDRAKFLELGGFDELYLPGRLEDLDFAYRGYQAGYHACYVPQAVAYHRGCATFGRVYGSAGCDELALRNTLLFQWKNLRHPLHLARQGLGMLLRAGRDVLTAPLVPRHRQFVFLRALGAAIRRWREAGRFNAGRRMPREREFFLRFHPRQIHQAIAPRAVGRQEGGAVCHWH